MTAADVPAVIGVQEPGAILGLAGVFPQDQHPFPREAIAERWVREIDLPGTDCFVVLREGSVAGFVATRGDEFLHFGIAVDHWGTGLAMLAHDEVLDHLRERGIRRARLASSRATAAVATSTKSTAGSPRASAAGAPSRPTPSSSATRSRSDPAHRSSTQAGGDGFCVV